MGCDNKGINVVSIGDFTRIATNSLSNATQFEINRNAKRLSNDFLPLSTDKRINSAEDDSASFSIFAKLSARLAALEQAQLNVSDTKSILDIMEQSLSKIAYLLNDVRKYVIQATNGMYGQDERGFLQRSIIGILQSRLSYRETSLRQSIISNELARSRLHDTNIAKSYSDYLRVQILQRYQTALVAQANFAPVSVLGLLLCAILN